MQKEQELLNRAAVIQFLSRRIKYLKMRSRSCLIDLSQTISAIRKQFKSIQEEEPFHDAIEAELKGKNRARLIRDLQRELRKRQKKANKKKSKDRHKPTTKRMQDRHKVTAKRQQDRHKNPSADRHTLTAKRMQDRHTLTAKRMQDRHKLTAKRMQDRHTPTLERKQDRHKNPSADRHKRAVDPNRGGTMRDFFWDHRECSAMHCAANFAMEAASSKYWTDEDIAAWCVPVEDDDLVKVAHEYIKETKKRSDNEVCSVCGVVGLDGAGRKVPVKKLSVHYVGDIEDDSDWARIDRRKHAGELTAEAANKRKEMLHTTVVGGKRLRLYEKGVHGLQCTMCSSCYSQHKQIWKWQDEGVTVKLSRKVAAPEWSNKKKNVTVPPPANSFSCFDPGRLGLLPQMSLLEKTAIAIYCVAGCVHKVQSARDEIAKWRIKGHTIVFITNILKVARTMKTSLPRDDVCGKHRFMWAGSRKSYSGKHAKVLSMKRLRMDYDLVAGVINILKQTHYLYKDVYVEDDAKRSWEKMKTGVQVWCC